MYGIAVSGKIKNHSSGNMSTLSFPVHGFHGQEMLSEGLELVEFSVFAFGCAYKLGKSWVRVALAGRQGKVDLKPGVHGVK